MEFKKLDIRTWSMLGQRGTFGDALERLAEENEKIVALSADLCNTSGLDRFAAKFSERFLNVGIAEQNLMGVAAGIADTGKIVFAATFANFASLRACEMVRHFMGYMKCNVKLVGFGAGFSMEYFGNTHYGVEDIAAIRAIPNIVILSPADGMEVVKCVEAAAEYEGPVYLRLTGVMNQPVVYRNDIDFKIGKGIKLSDGQDITLIATGSMVSAAVQVSEKMKEKGVGCKVIDMHTIKPLDTDILKNSQRTKLFVTIEEHGIVGGLGSAVAEALVKEKIKKPLLLLGADGYLKAGEYSYMLEQHGLTVEKIIEKIEKRYREETGNDKFAEI